MHRFRFMAAAAAVAAGLAMFAEPAVAHERRTVSGLNVRVGWKAEPSFSGVANAVQLLLADADNKPIVDLGDTLKVQVATVGQTGDPLPLKPAFGPTFGTQGEYDAAIVPTRPGTYSFRFTGTVHGQPVDETFTSSDHTFDDVHDTSDIQFPAKDPTNGELAAKLDRLDPRIDAAKAAAVREATAAKNKASTATTVGTIGLIVGAIGVLVGLAGLLIARGARKAKSA